MDEATSAGRTRLVARVFDDLSDELCRVADMSEFVRLAHPNVNFAAAAEDACITISGLVEQLNTHVGLYEVDMISITIRLPVALCQLYLWGPIQINFHSPFRRSRRS